MRRKFTGKLNMPETDLNNMTYVLVNSSESFNLTKEFRNSIHKECGLVINYKGEDIVCEVGTPFIYHGVWMLNGICVDNKLWNLTGETITVIYDDMVEENDDEYLQKVL